MATCMDTDTARYGEIKVIVDSFVQKCGRRVPAHLLLRQLEGRDLEMSERAQPVLMKLARELVSHVEGLGIGTNEFESWSRTKMIDEGLSMLKLPPR